MPTRRRRRASAAILALLAFGASATAQAFEAPGPGFPGDPIRDEHLLVDPLLLDPLFPCPGEVAIFRSLQHGAFEYCRQHLRYAPGSVDCLRIIVPTCNDFSLGQAGLVIRGEEDRIRAGQAERIVCPGGPPPPMCPGAFPAGPIPRP